MSKPPIPNITDVERITAVRDSVVRNLQITQCYHELTTALATRIADHANWCAFATWASRQAGQTIRGEDLERALEERLNRSRPLDAALHAVAGQLRLLGAQPPVTEIRRVVETVLDAPAIFSRASDAVAHGNLKVFTEIGREFARFLTECGNDTEFDGLSISRFCDDLRDGEPPEGQRYLRQAFDHYYRALFENDPKKRAELILLANLEVGFHEQTRLQPQILEALNSAIEDPGQLTSRVISALFPRNAASILRTRRFIRRLAGGSTPLDSSVHRLVEQARREVRLVLTDQLMTLALSRGVVLKLGDDLRAQFPTSLARIENTDLTALLARVDPTLDTMRDSGAIDWSDLPERMHFIADLFRCHHASPELFDPPFDAQQVAALKANLRPTGRL
ncbi:MAG: hypothetical protein WEE89_02275 [Gemmatimonadota bacterium]